MGSMRLYRSHREAEEYEQTEYNEEELDAASRAASLVPEVDIDGCAT